MSVTINQRYPLRPNKQMEYLMHNEFLPAFERLYSDVDKETRFSPKYLSKTENPERVSYLNNVHAKGYRSLNHLKGLNLLQMESVLAKLAAYHAASACYFERNPAEKNLTSRLTKTETNSIYLEPLNALIARKFRESLYSYELRYLEDQVISYQKHIATLNTSFEISEPSTFNVLLLGACWTNNLLCHADAFGNIKDLLFVDYQYARHGPAIYDLFHALFIMPRLADKLKYFDAYVKFYHHQLIDNLKILKYKKPLPKMIDLRLSLLKYSNFGFEAVSKILPIVLSDENVTDLDDIFANEEYVQQIRELLPWLNVCGFMEE